MIEIDKKELCRLKKAKRIRRVFRLPMLLVMLITYSLVGILLILYGIFSMPDCWFKKYIIGNPAVGITLYLVTGVLIIPLYFAILNKASSMEKRFGEYLCSIDISSDEALLIGEKYGFDGAFEVALQKRLRELGISEVPRKCTDGREILRLPTKEDLEFRKRRIKLDLFSIPCEYDGYDMVFEEGITDVKLYETFNEVITDRRYDINTLSEYHVLLDHKDEKHFDTFYDCWIRELEKNNFVFPLDNSVGIFSFAKEINRILRSIGSGKQLDEERVTSEYRHELMNYSLSGKEITSEINYDVLEANIVAKELRKIGYELICLFNGFDNNVKAIISMDRISELKEIEAKIKE